MQYESSKKYVVSGSTLNDLYQKANTAQLLPGSGYDLDVSPGKGTTLKLRGSETGAVESAPWGLEVVSASPAQVKVHVGTIAKSPSNAVEQWSIAGAGSTWSFGVGTILALRMTGTVTAQVWTLVRLTSPWPGHPDKYEFDGNTLESYHEPLWIGRSTEAPGSIRITDNLWAQRLVGREHCAVIAALNYTNNPPVRIVPLLVPNGQAMP